MASKPRHLHNCRLHCWHPRGVWLHGAVSGGADWVPQLQLLPSRRCHLLCALTCTITVPHKLKRRGEIKADRAGAESAFQCRNQLGTTNSTRRSKEDPREGNHHPDKQLDIHLERVTSAGEALGLLCSQSLPRPWVKGQPGKRIVWVSLLTALQK